jgi:hypothetical protein
MMVKLNFMKVCLRCGLFMNGSMELHGTGTTPALTIQFKHNWCSYIMATFCPPPLTHCITSTS